MVAKYPAIPEPTIEPTSLRDAVLSLKQAFEILTGQRGNPSYAALVLGDALPSIGGTITGNLTVNGSIASGDITTLRAYAPATGAYFFGNTNTKWLYYDGTAFNLHGGALVIDQDTPWTAYTPSLTAGSGAFGSATAQGRYKVIGKTVFVTITINITANGTAASYILAGVPVAVASASGHAWTLVGRENALGGQACVGVVAGGSTFAFIQTHNAVYPGGNGFIIQLSGAYESA